LIPTRYPGSETSSDGLVVLARKTVWEEKAPDAHYGFGQRILTTDSGDVPLLEVRELVIGSGSAAAAGAGAENG